MESSEADVLLGKVGSGDVGEWGMGSGEWQLARYAKRALGGIMGLIRAIYMIEDWHLWRRIMRFDGEWDDVR